MSMWEAIEREAALLAQDEVFKVAEKIAAEARRNYRLSDLKKKRRMSGVVVERGSDGNPVVLTRNSFAHLDEYGSGANLLSTPSAAMRRAAMKHGRFTPRPKGA